MSTPIEQAQQNQIVALRLALIGIRSIAITLRLSAAPAWSLNAERIYTLSDDALKGIQP